MGLRAHVWSPHIILADYRLSEGVDGLQLIRAARRQLSQATPAILVTGNTEEPALRLLTEDTIRVLFKPVKPYVLRATLHELLQFASFASPNAVVD
jgi:CheY-like chemotaxis protein